MSEFKASVLPGILESLVLTRDSALSRNITKPDVPADTCEASSSGYR